MTTNRSRCASFSAAVLFALSLPVTANAQTQPPTEKPAEGVGGAGAGSSDAARPSARTEGAVDTTLPAPSSSTSLPQLVPPLVVPTVPATPEAVLIPPAPPPKKEDHWYDKLHIRGYTQLRYNRFPSFDENDKIYNDQGDKSIGAGNNVFIRRARVILYGDVHEHVFVYLQPDFASSIGTQPNVTIVRDWYADLAIDKQKEFRFRVGQSKVPFGFENLQSSQNRLPLDRNDAINSAQKDERDIGVFFYWAPAEIRKRFKHLVDSGLKGSGDYGVLALGVYNGQGANRLERNDNLHVVGRLTWPFKIGEQYLEIGGGGYIGKYNVTLAPAGNVTYELANGQNNLDDQRAIASIVLYPQPIGFAAEYNIGRGPSQGTVYPTVINSRKLQGGYAQVMLKLDNLGGTTLIPYARYTYFDGGKKFEDNVPHYNVKELEMGAEWQLCKALEITAAYAITDRTTSKAPYTQQQGHLTRLQVQFNY